MTCLCEVERSPVEVFHTHRSRRRICPSMRTDLRLLPTGRLVSVETPARTIVKVMVRLWVEDGYVRASADPIGRVRGEDPDASCEFPLACELLAERIALESL